MTLRAVSNQLQGGTIGSGSTISAGNIFQDYKQCTGSVTANNTAVLANVTGLTGFSLTNGGIYQFEIELASTVASATGGIAYAFNYTTATLSAMQCAAIGYLAAGVQAVTNTTSTTNQALLFTQAAVVLYTRLFGTFTCSATGTLAVQMAQSVANASNTITLVGSSGKIVRLS